MKQILDNLEDFITETKGEGIGRIYKKLILEGKRIEKPVEDGVIDGVEYTAVVQLTARRPPVKEDSEAAYLSYVKLEGSVQVFDESDEEKVAQLQANLNTTDNMIRKEIQKMYPTCRITGGVILP